MCTQINATGATCGGGTDYPSGVPEFTPVFSGVRVARSFVLCVKFCRSLSVLLSIYFVIVLLILLRFTDFDDPFGTFILLLLDLILTKYPVYSWKKSITSILPIMDFTRPCMFYIVNRGLTKITFTTINSQIGS